eukprot:8478181-Prorocentrum_lima.AAC.1
MVSIASTLGSFGTADSQTASFSSGRSGQSPRHGRGSVRSVAVSLVRTFLWLSCHRSPRGRGLFGTHAGPSGIC